MLKTNLCYISSFISIITRPPRPTLFPYTTLFRSVRIRHRHEPACARIVPSETGFHAEFTEPQRAIAPGQAAVVYHGARVLGDRKSTRLNSSHVSISYAVFCLKKKKIKKYLSFPYPAKTSTQKRLLASTINMMNTLSKARTYTIYYLALDSLSLFSVDAPCIVS